MNFIKVVVADRHPIVLEGLSRLLRDEREFDIVACCSDGASCIDALRTFAPDVLVFDALLPGVTALEVLSIINSEKRSTRLVLFISSEEENELVMSGAARNYSIIPKNMAPDVLVESLRQIAYNKRPVPMPSSDRTVRAQNAITGNALTTLTEREWQIVHLVSGGLSNKEVARRLKISDGTIKVHLHNIFQKLEISNRTVLAALAISNGGGAEDVVDRQFPSDKDA